ncbi:PAS domain-containing protein [Caldimonas brevitalea]|uniref:histidine kinase n=1 Tax=Caldimonas brevitalea TaxID=413882 RepID=A0A0G3BBG4_9BURK|nr:PAS domain-containing protein [Caldimonas brevitalea]AKJ26704.1 sensory box histidine kinase/response regulator [Caldimonas brevitalea]
MLHDASSIAGPPPAPFPTEADNLPPFLRGEGHMAALIRQHDWASTPLGTPSGWPQSLKTLVGLMLASRQPMFMAWGSGQTWLYNDAFVPILGLKHPRALGQAALDVWGEARDDLKPLFDRVFGGEPVHMDDISLMLDRRGWPEESHFAFSYTPARDEQDRVAGLFGVCIETTDQVLADRRQAAAQARQRRMFEQAPGFIAILQGPQHVFEFVNQAYVRLAGSRDLIGRSVREAFPDVAEQGFFELLDQVYASGQRYGAVQVPVRFHMPGQATPDERYLNFIYEPVLDDAGEVTGIFVEGHDVTEVHRAQVELAANERRQALLVQLGDRLRELDDPADLSYAAAELLGRALAVSRAGYGVLDAAGDKLLIERDWHLPGTPEAGAVLPLPEQGVDVDALKHGETVVWTDAPQDAQTQAPAAVLPARTVVGMPISEHRGVVGVLYLHDATPRWWAPEELAFIREVADRTRSAVARRRAEKDLLALTASLEQQVAERTAERDRVWRNSRDLLVVVDAHGIFRAVNPAWTVLLGHAADEVVGRSFLDFVWPDDAVRTQAALASAMTRGDLSNFENRYRHCDGTPRWLSWYTAAEGDLVYAYGRDITAQKAQARALQQAEEALRQSQKLEAMGQLTGGVAHDFNNLLAVVSNNVYLHRCLSPACADSPQLAAIARATDTGARLTRQLLAFSRRQAIRPEPLCLQQELPELLQVLQATLGGQIEVRLQVAPDTPSVKVDRSELELALINLAVNARDAMPDGGCLTITVDRLPPAPDGSVESIRLEVSDTGHGIPPELLSRVLEPFFTTKGPGRGTGLGLSQVYGFATQAGGQLDIASEPGVSTTITLVLPATDETLAHPPSIPGTAAARLAARVLVVEDNADVGAATRELLQAAGCEVLHVTSGEQARAYLQAGGAAKVDLVLSDLVMPGDVSGVALAQWIEQQRLQLPVLLATGYSTDMAAATEQGYVVLQKPVTPETLLDAVRRAVAS